MQARLIVFSGLPGTGKSSLAEAVAHELDVPVFAKDWVEATLVRCGLERAVGAPQSSSVAYELLTTLAERQLCLGQSAILDSVAGSPSIRTRWRELASAHRSAWRVIECVCSDEARHRARLEVRRRGIPCWPELDWPEFELVRARYAAWSEDRLILDALDPLADNVAAALRYLQPG